MSCADALFGRVPPPRWLVTLRVCVGLFSAGYTDTNTVQRAHIFISGMSGNMVNAAISTVAFEDIREDKKVPLHLLAYAYVLYVLSTAVGHRVDGREGVGR